MNLFALVVWTMVFNSGTDGGVAVQVREVGRYPEAACRQAAADLQKAGDMPLRSGNWYGSSRLVAICVPTK